jgi:hypothetical protein
METKKYIIRCTVSVPQFGYVEGASATDENGVLVTFADVLEAQKWMDENLFHHNIKTGVRCWKITHDE